MKKRILILLVFFIAMRFSFAQTVSGWDAVVTSQYGTNNYHLIGTYQGWDPNGIYIAGYNYYNNSSIATKRIYIGDMTIDLLHGNVGIATSDNANWQLSTSAYKLAVDGGIITTNVTVKTSANWPDYVFQKNFELSSLNEVKSYIDQNHHLPGIPAEAEVYKNGLNLGEIDKALVKKVEELTLYLIEKDAQIKGDNEKIKMAEDKIQIQQQENYLMKAQISLMQQRISAIERKLSIKANE